MQFHYNSQTEKINNLINSSNSISFIEFLEKEIYRFLHSKHRHNMLVAEEYYKGNHDILKRKRTVIGKDGLQEEIFNLPNNRLVDNQYGRLVDQKNSYLLSKPITFYSQNSDFIKLVRSLLNKSFLRIIKNIGEDSINCGVGYLYTFVNENGQLEFKRFRPYEILPFWEDDERTKLNMAIRIYNIEKYNKTSIDTITQVELYTKEGVHYYFLDNGKLLPDYSNGFKPYIYNDDYPLHWDKIPIISFKSNSKEIPLIKKVKTLQDALNTVRSDFINNMQEDARNTILVLKNYDGTNISEFRKNLAEYGVVKVRTIDGVDGSVDVLKVNVDSNNYNVLANMLKKSIIENARGYDSKDDRLNNNPNQMNIQSIYSDIDLDVNSMEVEFQYSFENLFWFIKTYLQFSKKGDFFDEEIEVIFNKDILINETEAIQNCIASLDILSKTTIVSQHPWVSEVDKELERIELQNKNN